MAKYKVEQFSRTTKDNGRGYLNLYIFCKLLNEDGNASIREYRISTDTNYPVLDTLACLITDGFTQAYASGGWVEISEFKARSYLTLTLPCNGGKQQIRVTGECCYALRPAVLNR